MVTNANHGTIAAKSGECLPPCVVFATMIRNEISKCKSVKFSASCYVSEMYNFIGLFN